MHESMQDCNICTNLPQNGSVFLWPDAKAGVRLIDPIGQQCRMWTHIRLKGHLI